MKQNAISQMTPEQAASELKLRELEKLIRKAKKAYEKAQEAEAAVFQMLDNMHLDLEAPSEAENAENLDQAVACYLNYGEFSLSGLMSEIRMQYTKRNEQ